MTGKVVWAMETHAAGGAALAVIRVSSTHRDAGVMDAWLERVGLAPAPVGAVRLRSLFGVDDGIVARWSSDAVWLTPHGGAAVARLLVEALESSGADRADELDDPWGRYPEAGSLIEARALDALARATSPRAIDLLVDQPRRWSARDARSDPARDRLLHRLIEPPIVVAVGPANVGKSTLLNALARRTVASVAETPGTTRDHVGALVDLDGLVVRWVDTPGVRSEFDAAEARARALTAPLIASASLVVGCGDHARPAPVEGSSIRVMLRADAARADWPCDAAVSARRGDGLEDVARLIRGSLVPDGALEHPGPWCFWGRSGSEA